MRIVFWQEECEAWSPPEEITVSECADKYRILSKESAFPGPWDTSFFPWQREIMDSFAVDCIEEIWIKKAAKLGITDCFLNMLIYAIKQDPGPALIVEPNENLVGDISLDRIDPMITGSDELKALMVDLSKYKKLFRGMAINFAWAGSPASLAYKEIRYVLFDEVNKYIEFSGKEASPISLGKERAATFRFNRKYLFNSTPTIPSGYISEGEKGCSCRFRCFVPCPHCGHKQILLFKSPEAGARVKFPEDHDPDLVQQSAWYECEKCQGKIYNSEKETMLRNYEWIDIKSGLSWKEAIEKIQPKRVGFQISRLYSPIHSFGDIAAEFLLAQNDRARLMNWVNSWMGEDWEETVSEKKESEILVGKIDLPPLVLPEDTLCLIAGIDPGKNIWWFTVWAWLKSYTIHLVHYGSLIQEDFVKQLLLENVYRTQGGKEFRIWRAGMDTAGTSLDDGDITMSVRAYSFIRAIGQGNLVRGGFWGTKGASRKMEKHMMLSVIDRMPGKNGGPIPGGLNQWNLDTDYFKDLFHYRLQVKRGDPGGVSLHGETGEDFARHIMAEEKRRDRKGKTEWVQVNANNHWFDCSIIALAPGDPACWGGVAVLREESKRKPPPPKAEGERNRAPAWLGARENWIQKGNWIRR